MEFESPSPLHSMENGAFSDCGSRYSPNRRLGKGSISSAIFPFSSISAQHSCENRPLHKVTTKIHEFYKMCNPSFTCGSSTIPARILTQPSEPLSTAVPYDNKEGNLIARVHDKIFVPDKNYHYTIMDLLGTGTFGQVFRCLKESNSNEAHEQSKAVAVKVVKGKPAYRTQGLLEIKIAKTVNTIGDPHDQHHIVRIIDSFEDRGHICIVFELLSCSLLDVLTQNQFRGLPLEVVQRFTVQLLSALIVLQDTSIIHCDLKPENILLCPKNGRVNSSNSSRDNASTRNDSIDIKVIDFGSACFEGKTMYSYIQSRFYRSPEVLLGVPYNGAIDMWSLGCVCAEMYLGLPLFPGASQHNQLTRIVDMLGAIPDFMVEHGKKSDKFFVPLSNSSNNDSLHPFSLTHPQSGGLIAKSSTSLGSMLPSVMRDGGKQVTNLMSALVSGGDKKENAGKGSRSSKFTANKSSHSAEDGPSYRLLSAEEYAAANKLTVPTFRRYLRYDKLDDIIMKCPLPSGSGHLSSEQKKKEHYRRKCFLDFLKGVLNLNPFDRLTARQATEHPFVAKYFNKKSNIGTIKTRPQGRRGRESEGEAVEYIERRVFLPSYDEKVHDRVRSYLRSVEEVLTCSVSPSQLMESRNVYLTTRRKQQAAQMSSNLSGAAAVETPLYRPPHVHCPVEASCASHHPDSSSLNPQAVPGAPGITSGGATMGVSPGRLMNALTQQWPQGQQYQGQQYQGQQWPQDQQYQFQQHQPYQPYQQYQWQQSMLPPPPPSSLASSYDGPSAQPMQSSHGASRPPHEQEQDLERVSIESESDWSQRSAATSSSGTSGSYMQMQFTGGSFEFGNFLGGVSAASSLSSYPPGTPSSQRSHGASGLTPSSSLNTPRGSHMMQSSPSSSSELGQVPRRPDIDENKHLESFGFQPMHPSQSWKGGSRRDRSMTIGEHNSGQSSAAYNLSSQSEDAYPLSSSYSAPSQVALDGSNWQYNYNNLGASKGSSTVNRCYSYDYNVFTKAEEGLLSGDTSNMQQSSQEDEKEGVTSTEEDELFECED